MHIKYLAAGALPEATARLAGLPFVRRQFLACIPQRIFSRGPISLIAPCLKIGLGALRQERLPCTFENRRGPRRRSRRCRIDVRLDASLDKSRSTTPTDPHHGGCPCGSRSFRRGYRRSKCASIPRGHRSIGAGKLGHVPSKLTLWRPANSPTGWARNSCQLLPIAGVDKLAGGRPCLTFRMAQ